MSSSRTSWRGRRDLAKRPRSGPPSSCTSRPTSSKRSSSPSSGAWKLRAGDLDRGAAFDLADRAGSPAGRWGASTPQRQRASRRRAASLLPQSARILARVLDEERALEAVRLPDPPDLDEHQPPNTCLEVRASSRRGPSEHVLRGRSSSARGGRSPRVAAAARSRSYRCRRSSTSLVEDRPVGARSPLVRPSHTSRVDEPDRADRAVELHVRVSSDDASLLDSREQLGEPVVRCQLGDARSRRLAGSRERRACPSRDRREIRDSSSQAICSSLSCSSTQIAVSQPLPDSLRSRRARSALPRTRRRHPATDQLDRLARHRPRSDVAAEDDESTFARPTSARTASSAGRLPWMS